jgi:two-component system response regulator PilR (NtrC family)
MNEPALGSLLLVEDDALVARSLVRMLSVTGYDVVLAARGDDAIACLERRSFDVVLSDLQLPGASGLSVLAAARSLDADAALLLMSGAPTHASVVAAASLGVVAYFAKPLTREELLGALVQASRAAVRARPSFAGASAPPAG